MYTKLAIRNVKRQLGNYFIYFITVVFMVALMFAINNVIFSEQLALQIERIQELKTILITIVVFISLIVAFVLGYATSFLLKLRKREFGTYLTLGMTRKNIQLIFLAETAIICFIALGFGILFGLFIYQGLMAIMMHLMEMEFSFASYSPDGLLFTVILVIGVFGLSCVASAYYLKKVSIYELIHSEHKVEKGVRYPKLWGVITLLALAAIVSGIVSFWDVCRQLLLEGTDGTIKIFVSILFWAGGIILFHIGLAKSLANLILKNKKFCNYGTNTFVLRSLSGKLGANSVMIGMMAFLLTFAVIGANVSFSQKASLEAALDRTYPYDIIYCEEQYENGLENPSIPLQEAEETIETYKLIRKKLPYTIYTNGKNTIHSYTKWSGDGYAGLTDSFIAESEFNELITPLGYEPLNLEDEFFVVGNIAEAEAFSWENAELELNGKSYSYKGISLDYPLFSYVYLITVIPDEAIVGMIPQINYIAYDLENGSYDAHSLKQRLTYTAIEEYRGEHQEYERCDFKIREYGRQSQNQSTAFFVVGALFAAAVFLFMAMAILALKTLSGISEDKQRYQTLFRIGAGEKEQRHALFQQTFCFFAMPFLMALLMSIPTAVICADIMKMNAMLITKEVYGVAAGIAVVMTIVYLLYYTATYIIAKRAVICSSICGG